MKASGSLPALIFTWRLQERRGWYLIALGLASILFVGGTLLLFQVVYPASRPLTLTPQRIWLLDPSLPGARQIIAAAADKDFLLLGKSAADRSLPELAGQSSAVFAPSFKSHTLQPKDLLETRSTTAILPRLFLPQRTLLPAVSGSTPAIAPPPIIAQALRAVVTSGLAQRALTRQVELPASALPPDKTLAFYVAVAPTGQVKVVLPLTVTAAQADTYRLLRAQIAELRFTPSQTSDLEWGTLAFEWREDAP